MDSFGVRRSVSLGVERHDLGAADSGSGLFSGDLDVALLAPHRSPGISDDVVVLPALIGSVSNSGDGVVEVVNLLTTRFVVVDTASIHHEGFGRSIDGHRHRLLLNSSNKLRRLERSDVVVGGGLHLSLYGFVQTRTELVVVGVG